MQKKTLSIAVLSLCIIFWTVSCKKNSAKPVTNGNVAHALSDSFYIRALLDTTWIYTGNSNKDECESSGGVCSSFLIYGQHGSLLTAGFTLIDSAHPAPKDTTILSWVGKTFTTRSDTASLHAYTFVFSYPDTLGRTLSSDYVPNNTGATFTVNSVVYDGPSVQTLDSITPYKMYKVMGTFNCKVAHLSDTIMHSVTRGMYAINVIEAR